MDSAINLLEKKVRIHELTRLLRKLGERPGGAVCCQRMEGAADARTEVRALIRERIRDLELD